MLSHSRGSSAILLSCLLLLISWRLPAQQPQQPAAANSASVIKTNVNEVLVPVVVRDSQGHAVENLKKKTSRCLTTGSRKA